MSIPSLGSDVREFRSQLESFKETEPGAFAKKIFNRFLVENNEYMESEPILVSALCERFSLRCPRFKRELSTFKDLPQEILELILRELNPKDLTSTARVNKSLRSLSKEALLSQITFGKKKWAELLNVDVGVEPPLPPHIFEILNASCPIWPHKRVCETHMLVLIPKTIDGKPLTLISFGKCIKRYFPDHETGYRFVSSLVIDELGNQPIDAPYWVLMTDILPGSKKISYVSQQHMIAELSKKTRIRYLVPKTLEAIICICTQCISCSSFLSGKLQHLPFTGYDTIRCQEKVQASPLLNKCAVTVGPINIFGIYLSENFDEHPRDHVGIAALRRV